MLATIQLDHIDMGRRLREISEDQVSSLVGSIAEVGLLNPITVYRRPVIREGVSVEGYGLVAGAHRTVACQRLGLVEIEASIVDLPELKRQIAECDENLCGPTLTASEKALFTRRRKEAYEALHGPGKANGARAANAAMGRGDANENLAPAFTADTAKTTGTSERVVQLNAERGKKVIPEALEMIRGTALDTGSYLDKIKRLTPNDQIAAVKRDLAQERQKAKPVKLADGPLNDFEARQKQVAALMSAWNKAGKEAREEFLETIDSPTMDREVFGMIVETMLAEAEMLRRIIIGAAILIIVAGYACFVWAGIQDGEADQP